jgi:hypothetical protein
LAQAISSRNSENNNVPDFYYANYKFADDLEAIEGWFTKAEAKYSGDSAEYRRQKEQFFKSIAISERKKRKDVY